MSIAQETKQLGNAFLLLLFSSRNVSPVLKLAAVMVYITKTCLYNFDPLEPHLYIVKLGFTGVYINFLISAQNIAGGSNEYPQSMF